jgi:hypothetical protein
MAVEVTRQLTPSRCVGVIDGGVDVTKIDFAHETINLNKMGNEDEETRLCEDENPLTFSCREKLANLD